MATATIPGTSARGKRRNRKVESAKKNLTGNATNQGLALMLRAARRAEK